MEYKKLFSLLDRLRINICSTETSVSPLTSRQQEVAGTMSESFTIQISSDLVRHLVDDGESTKKKTKKPKSKIPRESNKLPKVPPTHIPDDSHTRKGPSTTGWPLQSPFFSPIPAQPAANTELDAIQSVLHESEKVVEKLQKKEENMLQEVTQRAKDLHEKEFKLPNQRPVYCVDERDACYKCYKENANDTLKCANLVNEFAGCARRVRQQVNAANN